MKNYLHWWRTIFWKTTKIVVLNIFKGEWFCQRKYYFLVSAFVEKADSLNHFFFFFFFMIKTNFHFYLHTTWLILLFTVFYSMAVDSKTKPIKFSEPPKVFPTKIFCTVTQKTIRRSDTPFDAKKSIPGTIRNTKGPSTRFYGSVRQKSFRQHFRIKFSSLKLCKFYLLINVNFYVSEKRLARERSLVHMSFHCWHIQRKVTKPNTLQFPRTYYLQRIISHQSL